VHRLAQLDHAHVWHPFTQMQDWLREEPIVLTHGKGSVLRDVRGRRYLDANSSIWTNLHGHNHPSLNAALRRQLAKVAHTSALGLANEPASLLAERLVRLANKGLPSHPTAGHDRKSVQLQHVFFSDNGSTATEVALKLAYEFTRRTRGPRIQPRFLSVQGAYHGDTIGAVSLGHIDLFHRAYSGLLFRSDSVMSPYCYRCPFNRAKPERADARSYRKCQWECVSKVEKTLTKATQSGNPHAGFVFEPLVQGAAGMIAHPEGWLKQVTDLAKGHGALLIADEVMTGFGRTGYRQPGLGLFASHREGVQPDFLCLAKGLTGGYMPMAATVTTPKVFEAFLGEYKDFKTFFHGHSYTSNQLGAAVSLANMDLLESKTVTQRRRGLEKELQTALQSLWKLPAVGDIRQVGLVAGIELVRNWRRRTPFNLEERAGFRVCEALTRRGVLTRPIGNVLVLMPPYCTTPSQLAKMVGAIHDSIEEVHGTVPTRPESMGSE
jgi:adenosylmethionine-8-amino-7-oxononanoate aminotransferase